MDANLTSLVTEFVQRTQSEPFLALSEGLVKVRFMEAALSLGWMLQEGAGQSPDGQLADFLSKKGNELIVTRGRRLVKLPYGSADFTSISPCILMLEFKSRSDFGTKIGAGFGEMWADVQRVADSPGVAFVFVFDEKIYRSFSGGKLERRGRPAGSVATWFAANFPPLAHLLDGTGTMGACLVGEVELQLRFWHQQVTSARTRIVVLGARTDMRCSLPI